MGQAQGVDREVHDGGRLEPLGIRAPRRLPAGLAQQPGLRRAATAPAAAQGGGLGGQKPPARGLGGRQRGAAAAGAAPAAAGQQATGRGRSVTPGRPLRAAAAATGEGHAERRTARRRAGTPPDRSTEIAAAELGGGRRQAFDQTSEAQQLSQALARCQRMALALAYQRGAPVFAGVEATPDLLQSEDFARRGSATSADTLPSTGWRPTDDDLAVLDTLLGLQGPEHLCQYCVAQLRQLADTNPGLLLKEASRIDSGLAQLIRRLPALGGGGDSGSERPQPSCAGSELADPHDRPQRAAALALRVAALVEHCADLPSAAAQIQNGAAALLRAERCVLYLAEGDHLVARIAADSGGTTYRLQLPRGSGIPGAAAAAGAPVNVTTPASDPRFQPEDCGGAQAVLAVPLLNQGAVLGVLHFVNRKDGRSFAEADVCLAESLAAFCTPCLQRLADPEPPPSPPTPPTPPSDADATGEAPPQELALADG